MMIDKILKKSLQLGTSTTARSLYWVFTSNGVSIILAFFSTILMARYLTKEEMGLYLALFTFANLFADLGEAGIGSSLSSFVPPLVVEKKESLAWRIISAAFRVEVIITTILLLAVGLFAEPLARILFAGTPSFHVIVTAVTLAALLLYNFSVLTLSAFKKFKETATISIFYSVIRLALIILLVLFHQLSLTNVLIVFLLAPLAGWLYSFVYIPFSQFLVPHTETDRNKLLHFSKYLALQKICVGISSRLDLLMLVPLSGAMDAGVYGVALRIAQIYPLVISSMSQVLSPKFAEFQKGTHAVNFFKRVSLVILLLLLSLGLFYIFASPLITLLFPKYTESIPVFRWLLVSMVGFVAATPFTIFLVYTLKKPQITFISTAVQLIIIFVSNLIFIPSLGRFGPIVGLGLGNMAIFVISVVLSWYYVRKEI